MVRREIKRFELIYGDTRLECGVPCSVKSALAAASCETDPKELDKVCFETDIYADEAAIAMKNFYLRLRGISMPARIYIGEEKIATTDEQIAQMQSAVAALFGDDIFEDDEPIEEPASEEIVEEVPEEEETVEEETVEEETVEAVAEAKMHRRHLPSWDIPTLKSLAASSIGRMKQNDNDR